MSKNEFTFESIKVTDNTIFNKVREAYGDKVSVFKAFSSEPSFIGKDDVKMHLADDGTKCCFMFNGREPAKTFARNLGMQLGVKLDVDSFIGYGTVYVSADKYKEAIQKGVNNLLLSRNGYWVDFYNTRNFFDYEPVLALIPHKCCYDKEGKLKKVEEIIIRTWFKSLERVLGEKIITDKELKSVIEIGIERTYDAHLKHEAVLEKIRKSGVVEKGPFEGYAYVDYYGKYIR